jgi:hypothetical protein
LTPFLVLGSNIAKAPLRMTLIDVEGAKVDYLAV